MNCSLIPRRKLMDALDKFFGARIVYICAPAGYGKTVAVRQWLECGGSNGAILPLDEFDNNSTHFCRRFCGALRDCQPENAKLKKLSGHPAFDSAPVEFTARAIAALCGEGNTRFAIDDLHFVSDERTLGLLCKFLKQLPESFHIALVSRHELPPGFSELWLKGGPAKITADELRFSREEIMLLYKENGLSVTSEQADEIHQFTDGWAIGLGALLLSGGEPHGDSLEYPDEYIRANIWQRWDEETREFMLKTAVVREMTPPLCFELTGVSNSETLLCELVKQNAFISMTQGGVYHYHSLFHDFLHKMLEKRGAEFSRCLLEKAGFWYLSQRDFYKAMECFIQCESHKGIIKCFVFLAVSDRASFIADKLLPILNQPFIYTVAEKFPFIYCVMSWAAFMEGRAADSANFADKYYENQLAVLQHDPRLVFYIVYVRLYDYRVALSELLRMVEKIPKSFISAIQDGVKPFIGIINQCMPLLHRGTRDFSECAEGDIDVNIAKVLKAIGGLFGDEANVLAECLSAGLRYEQGNLDKAYRHALAADIGIKESFASETKFCAMSVLVCILDALGTRGQADEVIERIADMIERDGAFFLNYNFEAGLARRKLSKGDMKAARDWLLRHNPIVGDNLNFYGIHSHLTTCRAYITLGDYDHAIIILKRVLELVTTYNRPLDIIETRILLSIACWMKSHTLRNDAILHLEQAVLLGHRYGYTQIFVNEGAEISGMLLRVQKRAEHHIGENPPPTSFVKMLYMKSAMHTDGGLTSGQTLKPAKFTDKQKAVMRLMCEGRSYKEMAEIMEIKLPSLRSHLSLIYKKLDVTNETDAVKKIEKLRILE